MEQVLTHLAIVPLVCFIFWVIIMFANYYQIKKLKEDIKQGFYLSDEILKEREEFIRMLEEMDDRHKQLNNN